jgi:hypothetical protein
MAMKICVGIALALMLDGCASQTGTPYRTATICMIDAPQICAGLKDKPITLGIERADQQKLEDNAPTTMAVDVPLPLPNGDTGAEVECFLNSHSRKVIYSRVTKFPQSEQAASYFKATGLCTN